jgi:inosine-uridine nucleoside N-ribohydrolase
MPLREQPVVIPGSSSPLTSRTPLRNAGVDRIISESQKYSSNNRLTVIIIGAGTDTASALLIDPLLADRIEIVAMAFNGKQGGDGFNVLNDPIAWTVILDSHTPVTVGDLTVTKRDLIMTPERAHALLDSTGEPGRYLAGLLDQWLAIHHDIVMAVTGNAKTWGVWDEVTVAYLLGMEQVQQIHRPKLKPDLSFDVSGEAGSVAWVSTINSDRLWADLARKLDTHR